jgi:hypothetical protein
MNTKETYQYVALSYVWGSIAKTLESRIDNFSELCVPGSLSKPRNRLRIPRTILDAMILTAAMGPRYLWVDRLCIRQDDPSHMAQQLPQMASVYSNSYFTIVAANGPDASYGLPGVGGDSSPRCGTELLFRFSPTVSMVKQRSTESRRDRSVWHTRAWTFQERAVSPRSLVFVDSTVHWDCRCAVWHENVATKPGGSFSPISRRETLPGWPAYGFRAHPWPDLEQYFCLVQGYNVRNLTVESDALFAFSAITNIMSHSFPSGFHFGIPHFLFDIGLLWSRKSPLKRRNSFPSWSWLGWCGDITLGFGYCQAWQPKLDYSDLSVDVYPFVDWYMSDKNGQSRSSIDNSYHQYKSAIYRTEIPLPEGWTKAYNTTYNKEEFSHSSLPGYVFKFPCPVPSSIVEDTVRCTSSYLNFRTKSFHCLYLYP